LNRGKIVKKGKKDRYYMSKKKKKYLEFGRKGKKFLILL